MAKRSPESRKLERLTDKDMKIINGPIIGDPVDANVTFPIRQAVAKADKAGIAYHDRSIRPEGRQPDDKNASIARDYLIYIEYGKLLSKIKTGKSFISKYYPEYKTNRQIAIKEVGVFFGIGFKSAEAAINRTKKLQTIKSK